MSGGSGGGGGGGGGGFVPRKPVPTGHRREKDPCDISIQLPLSATNPANIKNVKAGDILNVAVQNSKGVSVVVALAASDKSVVGSIAYRDVQVLIDCMDEGHEYVAKIISLTTTSVKVQVSRK